MKYIIPSLYSIINVFFSTILYFNNSKARKEIRIIKFSIHFNSGNATSRSNDGTYEDYVTDIWDQFTKQKKNANRHITTLCAAHYDSHSPCVAI